MDILEDNIYIYFTVHMNGCSKMNELLLVYQKKDLFYSNCIINTKDRGN